VTVRQDHLRLGFLADHAIEDERIVRRLNLGPRRVGHSVILRSPTDIDTKLIRCLRAAYALQARG
jgi:hypothetical protein